MFQFHLHFDKLQEKLAAACAVEVADVLKQSIATRGQAVMALSGGKSPRLFLEILFGHALDWAAVTLVPVDERWVPLDHKASNEGMIRQILSNSPAARARWVSLLVPGHGSAHQAESELEQNLVNLLPKCLDIVVLGMGEDGHTASWFPHSPQRDACLYSERRCLAVDPVSAEHERMTLTASYILQARQLFVYAPGAKKIATLSLALQQQDVAMYPVTKIFQHPHLHWWTSALSS